MKRRHHNLKLIIPSKANELFSISKYQKMSSDNFINSFFSTQYNLNNKTYNFSSFGKHQQKMYTILKNKTNYSILNKNYLDYIPFPSFPNKKPIPSLYKNSIKLVKYPKVPKNNFTLYNFNNIFPKINDDEKTYNNIFLDSRMNTKTQSFSKKINKTEYKGKNNLMKLNISPIKKQPKIKYRYKLYTFEKIKNIKNELKKKLNINNFEAILNNMIRLIDMRDEHNNEIKYDKVTNLLIDEIYNLIQAAISNKQNIIKNLKNSSTSISDKYFNRKKNKLDTEIEETASLKKKARSKTFIPQTFQVKNSFNLDFVNKVEDKEFLNFYNKQENFNKNIQDKIKKNSNEDSFEVSEDENNGQNQIMKGKYHNLLSKLNERRGNYKKNLNFDNNNNYYKKNDNDNNIYNYLFNDNNKNDNKSNNNNSVFGNSNNFIFNDFFNQNNKKGKSNKINKSNDENINILNLLSDISSKIEKKAKLKNDKDKQDINKGKNISIDTSKNQPKGFRKSMEIKGIKNYEKFFKNKKLSNLFKQFFKTKKKYEEDYTDEISDDNDEDKDEEYKRNSSIKKNESNTIDDYTSKKTIDIEKIKRKRKRRKARTDIIKEIDLGIEIIKNICEEINLNKEDKEDLYNIFTSLKNISFKPEISKDEEEIQDKSLNIINDFIQKYLMDLQNSELVIKLKQKKFLSKYFKVNLNDKLNEILSKNETNNIIPKKEKNEKNKVKKRQKNSPRKKLIYDNSFFFRTNTKRTSTLKLSLFSDENTLEAKKETSPYYSPKRHRAKNKFKSRKAIFSSDKKIEGLRRILPIEGKVLTEKEKKIEMENLLDRRLKAFFEEIKLLKNIKDDNKDRLNFLIDKEVEKFDYAQDKCKEIRKYNFFEDLRINGNLSKKEKKNNTKKDLFFQSPLIFNIHKDNNK